jgi:predicted glycogen debranching enzyme
MNYSGKQIDELHSKEWIYTNGLGGYASSTITGCNTRRYHGLLVASFNPPTDRRVLVSKTEETIVDAWGNVLELATNQYNGSFQPVGYKYLMEFERKPFPTATFKALSSVLTKTIYMLQGSNTTVVEYCNTGTEAYELRATVFLSNRDYHSLLKENNEYNYWTENFDYYKKIYAYYGAQPVFIKHSNGEWQPKNYWHKNYEYRAEKERGLDFNEDCFAAGEIVYQLQPGKKAHLTFSTDEGMMKKEGNALRIKELKVQKQHNPETDDLFLDDLIVAGNQFIVQRMLTKSASIIAGYHWFADWGRDTMIAMRGLCIATSKKELSQSILKTFLQYLDAGMLPNRFPDWGEDPEYNTIDATLWLFIVLHDYQQKFNDIEFIKDVFPQLTSILEAHIKGTRYQIHITDEGLLYGGEGNTQLTWMDARVDDYVVTPRHGCPVEINMLWYNALKIYDGFAKALNNKNAYSSHIKLFEQNFKKYFLNAQGYLNDVVIPNVSADESIRPNMIYAISLPYTVLTKKEQQKIVAVVKDELLTNYGLRTLQKNHPDFKPVYQGDTWQRDNAYHQGTVWPFLIGEFFTAYLKMNKQSAASIKQVQLWILPLKEHFYNGNCIHGVSEIFDGENPATGKGTIHQAWSVSALIKVLTDIKISAE